jgi:hypothetical protein
MADFEAWTPAPGAYVPLPSRAEPISGVRGVVGNVLISTALSLGPADVDAAAVERAPHPVVQQVDAVPDLDTLVASVASRP